MNRFFATAGRGIAQLLGDELRALGARRVSRERAGAAFTGSLETAYRICLWSRLANRVLMPLARFEAADADALYAGARDVPWHEHADADSTLAVDATCRDSALRHTRFIAQRVKDAVVDTFRERDGRRPSVELRDPDIRLNVHIEADTATLSLDLSGDSLHRRGYRADGGTAPLKENLAAAILIRAGWPEAHGAGAAFLDPMCGSGTLLIEAALLAGDVAPGLHGRRFGFEHWHGHSTEHWHRLLAEAEERRSAGLAALGALHGSDADPRAIELTRDNALAAGVADNITLEVAEIARRRPPASGDGTLVVNPPYGERMGERVGLRETYAALGRTVRDRFSSWRVAVFTADPDLAGRLGLAPARRFALPNGALDCELLCFDPPHRSRTESRARPSPHRATVCEPAEPAPMLSNRLRKNLRTTGSWARREGIECYRLYDADMPEYALAIDLYQSEDLWAHVQEYEAPSSVDASRAATRLAAALASIEEVLEIPRERIVLKQRRRGRGGERYGALGRGGMEIVVREAGVPLLVNLTDHLDTGLFLDHRKVRELAARDAVGRSFLNLFAYTGSASVRAAAAGAARTLSVDLSPGYLEQARRNLELSGFGSPAHACERADCLAWLTERDAREQFGVILLDPPTFSNSKRMGGDLDLQRDHPRLIAGAARLLEPDGVLYFSTNSRRLRLDEPALGALNVREITRQTIPRDFSRNPRIHRCWRITLDASPAADLSGPRRQRQDPTSAGTRRARAPEPSPPRRR